MSAKKQVRAMSGAADEITYLIGNLIRSIDDGDKFDCEHGISSGAITQFVRMCGDIDKVKGLALRFTIEAHVIGYNPLSKKGIAKALKSIILKQDGLWKYNKLKETIRSVTSEDDFNKYTGPPTYVGVCHKKGIYHDVRIDTLSYEDALQKVIESATIDFLIKSETDYVDGGLINHIGSEFLAVNHKDKDVVSVFARTNEWHKPRPKGFLKQRIWHQLLEFHYTSVKNEKITDWICKSNDTSHIKHFMTEDVIEGFFNIKDGDHKRLYDMGYNSKDLLLR